MSLSTQDPEFVDRTEAIVRLGSMLLAAGTGAYRVKTAMDRAAAALGMDFHDVTVTLTSITMTVHAGDSFRTICRQVHKVGVDASRIEALEHLSHRLTPGMAAADLEHQLDVVARRVVHRWSGTAVSVAAGVACAAFAVLNKFSLGDAAAVLLAASLGQAVRRQLLHRRLNHFGVTGAAATVAGVVYLLVILALSLTPWRTAVASGGYVASLLFLIPGFPMITSLLDMARLDFGAGLQRAGYAAGQVIAATLAAWVLSYASGLQPHPGAVTYPGQWFWVAAALASFCGVAGFAILFNSSRRMVLTAACLGTLGNVARLLLVGADMPHQLAAGCAGLLIGLLAALVCRSVRVPRITATVPACVIMVPGTAMYRMMYWLNAGDMTQAISFGADAVLTVFTLTCGLAVARMLTDPAWAFSRPVASPHAFRTEVVPDEVPLH